MTTTTKKTVKDKTTITTTTTDSLYQTGGNSESYKDAEENELKNRVYYVVYNLNKYRYDDCAFAFEEIENYYKTRTNGTYTVDGTYVDYSTLPDGKFGFPIDKNKYPRTVLTSCTGIRQNPTGAGTQTHGGLDISGHTSGRTGPEIHAAMAGKVVIANVGGWGGGYGTYVVLQHSNGYFTLYGHMSSIGVTVGQELTAGQQIGIMGTTGNSTGVHLHFEVRYGGKNVWSSTKLNPMYFFEESTLPNAVKGKCMD